MSDLEKRVTAIEFRLEALRTRVDRLASEVESPAGQQLPCCGGTLDHDLLCPNFED